MPISNITPPDHTVDLVFCLDMTGANTFLEQLRSGLGDLRKKLADGFLEHRSFELEKLRVRFVFFKDYAYDYDPIVQTPFFGLPEQTEEVLDFISKIYPRGGGDLPECAFEGLAYAVRSDWTAPNDCHRRIICLATDAPSKPLGECRTDSWGYVNDAYPADMPNSVDDILSAWGDLPRPGINRIMLFAPDNECWAPLLQWDGVYHVPLVWGNGGNEVEFVNMLIDLIANT